MSQSITPASRDLKKLLDNPKIIFVLGGPASGKGTQCEKIVQEFGFSHISTGDLMRQEVSKGTKEGEKIKKIQKAGGLVPFELTVQILINGLIATPSKTKTYLIDGFPRAIDQATYFEKHVIEAHQILFYDVPQELMLQRCMKRAETSGRADDNAATIQKRVENYFSQSVPVVDYYKQFGKVHHLDATGSIAEVYAQTKKAILPQCMFLLGPKGSGKTTVGKEMAERTNMKLVDFNAFVNDNGLLGQDDEKVTENFIQSLAKDTQPRLVIENFPQNIAQATYFVRNGTQPSNVFSLKCSKDICQERMIDLGEDDPNYVPSAILTHKIRKFHMEAAQLIPYFKTNGSFLEISTEQPLQNTLDEIYTSIEPLVIHVRPQVKLSELRDHMIKSLVTEHNFINLDIAKIQRGNDQRQTDFGIELNQLQATGQNITTDLIIRMLKKIVYCGQPSLNKFILSNFPDTIDHVKLFEKGCATIAAMIYPTKDLSLVEIKGNASHFSIDSYFQKTYKLKTMKEWDYKQFEEKLGHKVQFGFMVGKSLSGKSTVAKFMEAKLGFTIIDMKAETEKLRESKGTEDEPFTGDIPVSEVEERILGMIKATKKNARFIFDDYTHKNEDEFLAFVERIGVPDFILFLTASEDAIKARFLKKNELEEFPEDKLQELKDDSDANKAKRQNIQKQAQKYSDRCKLTTQNTDQSLESVHNGIKKKFSPCIMMVKHDKKFAVDNSCANLSIKYNMLYISVYQLIQREIENHTEWGQKLTNSKNARDLAEEYKKQDEFLEEQYSPVHYESGLVHQLINKAIADRRTDQKVIMLEGVCNSKLLAEEDDQMAIRNMDELFSIEQAIGEVSGIVSLQTAEDALVQQADQIEYEKFPEPAQAEQAKKVDPGEGDGDGDNEPAEAEPEAEEGAKPVFKPEEFEWTVTNRKSKNLAQLFVGCKGASAVHEVKQAADFGSNRLYQIAQCLDDFCARLHAAENSDKSIYQQVLFA